MPEGSAEANLDAFDGALARAARALRAHGFLPSTAAAGGSDAPTLALSSSAGNLQASTRLPASGSFTLQCLACVSIVLRRQPAGKHAPPCFELVHICVLSVSV